MSSINTTSTRWAMFLHLKLSILEGGAVNARPTSRPQFTGLRRELHFLQNNGVAKRKRSFIGSRGFGQQMTSCPIDLCAGCQERAEPGVLLESLLESVEPSPARADSAPPAALRCSASHRAWARRSRR